MVLHVSYVAGLSLRGVKDMGMVRAFCNVIGVSACWQITVHLRVPLMVFA